jgi:uncharacterized protein HemY
MKRLLIIVIFLSIAIFLGTRIAADPGYVLVARSHWTMEMPLWLAILLLMLLFFLGCGVIRALSGIFHLPKRLRLWLKQRRILRKERVIQQTTLGALYQADTHDVSELLPLVRKQKWLSEGSIRNIAQDNDYKLLKNSLSLESLKQNWKKLPVPLQKKPCFLNLYVKELMKYHCEQEAELLARKALNKHWDSELAFTYGLIDLKPSKQLKYAEHWLIHHNQDCGLLLSLGRICMRMRLFGKARYYLESSLKLKPTACAYRILGELLESLGDMQLALNYYKTGLALKD